MSEPEATGTTPESAPDVASGAPAPEAPRRDGPPEPELQPARRPDFLPWLCLVGFVVLAAAIIATWLHTTLVPRPTGNAAALASLNQRVDQIAGKMAAMDKRVASLPPAPDLGPIEARLSALEHRPPPAPAPPSPAEVGAAITPLSDRIDSLDKSLAGLALRFDKVEHMARVAAASVALEQGRPLGPLQGAPPALARFATTAPPTLVSLRLSFPQAARAEAEAARPSGAGKPFLQRVLLRLGDLFTLREGNRVIIGNPVTPTLDRGRAALDAGDLAGAVAALAALPSPLAPAMAGWENHAKALLAAETAMASFAGSD